MNATPSILPAKSRLLYPFDRKKLVKVLFEVAIFRHTKGEMRSILTYVSNFALKYNAKRALQRDFSTRFWGGEFKTCELCKTGAYLQYVRILRRSVTQKSPARSDFRPTWPH